MDDPGNLKAGSIYTLRYNGKIFILQVAIGGNATATSSGKTFSSDEDTDSRYLPNRTDMLWLKHIKERNIFTLDPHIMTGQRV